MARKRVTLDDINDVRRAKVAAEREVERLRKEEEELTCRHEQERRSPVTTLANKIKKLVRDADSRLVITTSWDSRSESGVRCVSVKKGDTECIVARDVEDY